MSATKTRQSGADPLNTRCYFTCRTCGRSCRAACMLNHRFDCCGVIVAHVLVQRDSPSRLVPTVIENPQGAGYLTGPSRTTARTDARR